MFKKASDATQSRMDRRTEFSRHNGAGVDPTAFAPHPQARNSIAVHDLERDRVALVNRKQDLEEQLSTCKAQIVHAERAFRQRSETALSSQLYTKLLCDRDDISARLFQANKELRANNLAIADHHRNKRRDRPPNDRRETFAATFYEIAKEMLAQPVIARLTAATIHRIGERIDEKRSQRAERNEPEQPVDGPARANIARGLQGQAPNR